MATKKAKATGQRKTHRAYVLTQSMDCIPDWQDVTFTSRREAMARLTAVKGVLVDRLVGREIDLSVADVGAEKVVWNNAAKMSGCCGLACRCRNSWWTGVERHTYNKRAARYIASHALRITS